MTYITTVEYYKNDLWVFYARSSDDNHLIAAGQSNLDYSVEKLNGLEYFENKWHDIYGATLIVGKVDIFKSKKKAKHSIIARILNL